MKVLIVDDDARTRQSVSELCTCSDDVQVVGEALNGRDALDALRILNPDVLFVDVDLPDMSGIVVLRAANAQSHSGGIMLADCGDLAAAAFAEDAIDYLLRPITREKFDKAMSRARDRLEVTPDSNFTSISESLHPSLTMNAAPRFLVGERQRRLYPLDLQMIDYIEADGNYVTFRVGEIEYLSRDSLKRLSIELEELGFVRIERSLLVNVAAVSYLEVTSNGTFALTLRSGVCLPSTRAYRDGILRAMPLPKRYRGSPLVG